MELKILKYGTLAGSPDIKAIMHNLKYDSAAVDQFWDHTHAIKLAFGLDGRSTSALLLEPDCPELFPALVDCSFLSADPATHGQASVDMALDAIRAAGVEPAHIKAHFVTHPHGDHMDPRLRQALPGAIFLAHPESGIPAHPIDVKSLPSCMAVINTPGHGHQHCSYMVDLKQHDLSVCLAGDLIMSHAHFLTLDHPTAFADHAAGTASVRAVMNALAERGTKYKMILPGHDIPFFVNP